VELVGMKAMRFATKNIPSQSESSSQARLKKLQNDFAGIDSQITTEQNPDGLKVFLVVDENEIIQETVKNFLGNHGMKVITTGNGLDALNHFHNSSFNLILTSICIPVVSGNLIAIYVKNHMPDIPIIAISQSVWMAEDYFDSVIEKPLDLFYLLQEILFQISRNSSVTKIV
jgi:CheY-like chemotaxis protein